MNRRTAFKALDVNGRCITLRVVALLLCLAAEVAPAQGDIPADVQQAFSDFTKLPNALVPVLREAKDRASADAVAPKLHELLPQIYDARTTMQGIRELPPQTSEAVRKKFEMAMRKNWGDFYQEVFRLQKANCFGSAALAKEFYLMCMMLK